jgi:hypothetical protein
MGRALFTACSKILRNRGIAEQIISVDEATRIPARNMNAARIGRASRETPERRVLASMSKFSL